MNVKALAERLSCSVSTARKYCQLGKIRAKRVPVGLSAIGWEISHEAVDEFLLKEFDSPGDPRGKRRGERR